MDNDNNDDADNEFFFESAHLALRGNSDYMKLLSHLTVLCSKRIQIHNDIESIQKAKQQALNDPLQFVEMIKNESLKLPGPIEIPELPEIDFSKYNSKMTFKHKTEDENFSQPSTSRQPININSWTLDEQRKLEELLNKYPPETVDSKRFVKIANEMNRTPKQIASRVQKFFKKLHDANLPIPGALPAKSIRNRHKQHLKHFKFEKPSTFFPERNVPSDLLMKEDSDDDSELSSSRLQNTDNNKKCDETANKDKALTLLKQIRAEKMSMQLINKRYSGYNCCVCHENLSVGARWHCNDCESDANFCADCLTSQIISESFVHLHHDVKTC